LDLADAEIIHTPNVEMDVYDTGRDDIADTLRQTVVITFAMSF